MNVKSTSADGGSWNSHGWDSCDKGYDYWISYADLLAGLLMVFALMLLTALYYYQGRVTDVRDLLETRREIISTLQERLGQSDQVSVVIDTTSGSVRFSGEVLFNEDSAELLPAGEEQLEGFAAQYLPVLLGIDRFREKLEAIVIEGHTNTRGSYIYNLDLSQRRAYNVMSFILEHAEEYRTELRQYATANGRSYSEPILLVQNSECSAARQDAETPEVAPECVDQERSRRIEIRFRLNDQEVIRKIMEELFLAS